MSKILLDKRNVCQDESNIRMDYASFHIFYRMLEEVIPNIRKLHRMLHII